MLWTLLQIKLRGKLHKLFCGLVLFFMLGVSLEAKAMIRGMLRQAWVSQRQPGSALLRKAPLLRTSHIRQRRFFPSQLGESASSDVTLVLLTEREKGTLRQYTIDSYMGINAWLRDGIGPNEGTAVRIIDRILTKLPLDLNPILYRREYRSMEDLEEYQEGRTVHFKGYTSASKGQRGGPGNVRITFVDSLTARDISGFSHYPAEQELLFPRGARFKVISAEWQGDCLHVVLQELEHSETQSPDDLLQDLLWPESPPENTIEEESLS